jgi:uncharacterized membrane protein
MTTPLIVVSLLLLGLSVLSLLMPWYARPDVFFGVTVLADFKGTSAARRISAVYRAGICGVAAVAISVALVSRRPVIALIGHILGTCAILIAAHHAAAKYASPRASVVEVDLRARPESMPGGRLAPFIPLLWLLGLGVWANENIAQLSARIVLHYGLEGPDRWLVTTPRAVIAAVGFPGLVCVLLAATAYGVLNWSRRISTSGPAAAGERRFRRLVVLLLLNVEYLLAALPLLILLGAPRASIWAWLLILWSTLLVFVVRLVRAGQGGTRHAAPTATTTPVGDRTDDAHWLGGLIYVNRADQALFVERRMGIGWTLNFGHVRAWLFIAALLAIPLSLRFAVSRSNSATPEMKAEAQTAALSWLGAIDAGDYARSWDTAAPRFRAAVPEDQWMTRIAALRQRLGPPTSRSVSEVHAPGVLAGIPNGEGLVIQFKTSFEHQADATETVTPIRDADGQWRVSGYYVK